MSSSDDDDDDGYYSYTSQSDDDDNDELAGVPVASLYVRVTRRLIERLGPRVYSLRWNATVDIDASQVVTGHVVPRCRYSYTQPRGLAVDARLVILSVRALGQDATSMPVDVCMRVLGAARPYVVRKQSRFRGIDEELVEPGVAYTNDVCSLAFCSLNALDFCLDTFMHEVLVEHDDGSVAVPKSYRYAELLRQVTMARQLEAFDPLQRRCATRGSLTNRPLETTTTLMWHSREVLLDAAVFVAKVMVPRLFFCRRNAVSVAPLSSQPWCHVLEAVDSVAEVYSASVDFVVYVAKVG